MLKSMSYYMRKILTLLFLVGISLGMSAQMRISVFVTSKVLSQDYQAFLTDQLVEAFTNSNQYIAVNRSNELTSVLNQVHAIQDNGYIDPKQIVNATKQYGETQVCGVNVYQVDDRYVFQASLVDIATAQITKTVSAYTQKDDWDFDVALAISQQLTAKLIGKFDNKTTGDPKENDINDVKIITFEHGGWTYQIYPDLGAMSWKNGKRACEQLWRKTDNKQAKEHWRLPTREEFYAITKKTNVASKKHYYWTSDHSYDNYYVYRFHYGWASESRDGNNYARILPIRKMKIEYKP